LQTYYNTVLGEPYEDEYETKIGASALLERASKEKYKHMIPPKEVLVLVAGVDTQDDRLSMSVWGIGRNEEMYLVDRAKIYGTPSRQDVWDQLDEIIQTPYKNEDGRKMNIEVTAVDTGGHFTEEVYRYTRSRAKLGVIAIKGQAKLRDDSFLSKPRRIDHSNKKKITKFGVELFLVGVNRIKTLMHRRLREAEVTKGALHFYPTVTNDYFEELTAEREIQKYKNGYTLERVWVKKSGVRNEALDELVYSYACLQRLYQIYPRRTIWDFMEKKYVKQKDESKGKKVTMKRNRSSNDYVNNW